MSASIPFIKKVFFYRKHAKNELLKVHRGKRKTESQISMLPKEAVEEFKRLYEKRFGIKLNDAEAILRANNLVNLYKAVYQPASFGRADTESDHD